MQEVKANSSRWINEKKFTKERFERQSGYGAFSYGKSQLPNVTMYIQNQEQHHLKNTFVQEYKAFLEKFEVDCDEQYFFQGLL